jgi:hypothetical protein
MPTAIVRIHETYYVSYDNQEALDECIAALQDNVDIMNPRGDGWSADASDATPDYDVQPDP